MCKIKCKKCESENVISYDSESLCHDEKWFKENEMQHDPEAYVHFMCNDCGHRMNKSFLLITPEEYHQNKLTQKWLAHVYTEMIFCSIELNFVTAIKKHLDALGVVPQKWEELDGVNPDGTTYVKTPIQDERETA